MLAYMPYMDPMGIFKKTSGIIHLRVVPYAPVHFQPMNRWRQKNDREAGEDSHSLTMAHPSQL